MLKHILVPLDESELAEKALEYAQQLVSPESRITLLSVVDVPGVPYALSPGMYAMPIEQTIEDHERLRKRMIEQAEAYLQRMLDKLKATHSRVDITVRSGNPAEVIAETAEELGVNAIVMSTHGRSGLSRWVFGSVTQKVLSITTCPVFVVPNRKKEPSHKEQKTA